jgi:hypothetical protein
MNSVESIGLKNRKKSMNDLNPNFLNLTILSKIGLVEL